MDSICSLNSSYSPLICPLISWKKNKTLSERDERWESAGSDHDTGQGEEVGPEEDEGGEEAGEEEDGWQSRPGLPRANLESVRAENDSVPVASYGHHRQGGHEDRQAGERLDQPAEGEEGRQGPGHVEPVHQGQGDGQGDHDVGDGQVENENIPSCPRLFFARLKIQL